MTSGPPALGVLQRVLRAQPRALPGERCEMCSVAIAQPHSHVVNLESRELMCTCRPCALLFTARGAAEGRYRAVPERYLSFPGFTLSPGQWDDLQLPVGLAFFFRNSRLGRVAAFYPSPAGATESELSLGAWEQVTETNPQLQTLEPDVEAVLVRDTAAGLVCYLVPIDRCYELVGHLRQLWRGFDGGTAAREGIDAFFADVAARSRPAPVAEADGR
ncbi:MAG: DUF5947 family protein [Actinomycetes bacterium]